MKARKQTTGDVPDVKVREVLVWEWECPSCGVKNRAMRGVSKVVCFGCVSKFNPVEVGR